MQKKKFSQKEILKISQKILLGLNYLHSRKIVHRDIKPENILLTDTEDVKICDLGFSAPFGENVKRNTMCGTREYLAPEIALRVLQSEKVDIWCFGVLIYEMLMFKTPFESRDIYIMGLTKEKKHIFFRNGISEGFKAIVRKCLELEARDRPSAEELLREKIFHGVTPFEDFQNDFQKANFFKNKVVKDEKNYFGDNKFFNANDKRVFVKKYNDKRFTNQNERSNIYKNHNYIQKKNYISLSPNPKNKIIRRNTISNLEKTNSKYQTKKIKYSVNYKSRSPNQKNTFLSNSFLAPKVYTKIVTKKIHKKNSLLNGYILKQENPRRIKYTNVVKKKNFFESYKRSNSVVLKKKYLG